MKNRKKRKKLIKYYEKPLKIDLKYEKNYQKSSKIDKNKIKSIEN